MITNLMPNQSPEPTAVGSVSSAIAVHVASRRWLSFLRSAKAMRFILMFLAALLLSGCPAGVAPLVGYPTGSKAREPEVVSSLPASPGRAEIRLYCQEIDHNYKLLASPDGGRDSISLKQSYRYQVRIGDGEMRELKFLRSDPGIGPHPNEYFQKLYSLSDRWVGYGQCSGARSDYEPPAWSPETPEEKAAAEKETSRYFITVFDPEKLIVRSEVVTMARRPGLEFRGDLRAVRYRGPSGWMLYMIGENRSKKEPNQPSEPTSGLRPAAAHL
jgi:hypothetical protein